MKVLLVRHGATQGNLEHRYIGSGTDEALCPAGIRQLEGRALPQADRVFVSPMKRCRESAAILFPGAEQTIVPGLQECAFGAFEGKSYLELNGNADYQRYIDSGGETAFPGGESRTEFARRSVAAFDEALQASDGRDCVFVVHGGTIMAVMERYARPEGGYFDFQVKNGQGFLLELPDGAYERLEG